jgi:hypothetical protein
VNGSFPEGPSALRSPNDESFPPPLIDLGQTISVLPPDSIPAIDEPFFVSVDEADVYLTSEEPVAVLEIAGEARAYPVQILMWHEVVNDTVGGIPVAITYCPLCNSAVTYERRIGGLETTFGTSGRLFNSALVMYDRATESLWTHFDGVAVAGLLTGERLAPIASTLLAWADFKAAYPDGTVLDRERTGYTRAYGRNPYDGYDNPDGRTYFPFAGDDPRLATKERVVGVVIGEAARAYRLAAISGGEARVTHDELAGTRLVVFWKAGQESAFEDSAVTEVGSVGVFRPVANEEALTFRAQGGRFVDDETGSVWDITGRAVDGPLADTTLERIHHLDTFWFAWSSYQPETDLVEGP